MSRLHPLNRSWSCTGTPIISQMTFTGIGYANSSIEIHRAGGLRARDQAVDDLLDARAQPSTTRGRERLADQAPEPRVIRRIAIQHREPDAARHSAPKRAATSAASGSLMKRASRSTADHVFVPGEHPEAERAVVDGILGAQAVVGRIRVRQELRIHRIEALHVARPRSVAHFGGAAGAGGVAGAGGCGAGGAGCVGTTTPGASWISSTSVTRVT